MSNHVVNVEILAVHLKAQLHEVILASIFLKTASKIQDSNLIGWVNVIGAARTLALASIMMSFANVVGRPSMGTGLGTVCIIWEVASMMPMMSSSGSTRCGARPGADRK